VALRAEKPQRQAGQAALEERAATAEDQREQVERHLVHQALAQEAADERAAIQVDAADPFALEPPGEGADRSLPELFAVPGLGRPAGADDQPLLAVRPLRKPVTVS